MNTPNLQYKINAGMGNKWRRFHIWSRFIDTATSAAENEAAQITHKLLGLEQFWFQKWNLYAKIALETKFQVSMTLLTLCYDISIM